MCRRALSEEEVPDEVHRVKKAVFKMGRSVEDNAQLGGFLIRGHYRLMWYIVQKRAFYC